MRKKKNKRLKPEEKANYNEMNMNQRQATSYLVRLILELVIGMLVAFLSIFICFNFIYHIGSSGRTGGKVNFTSCDAPYYQSCDVIFTNESTDYEIFLQ